MSNLAEDYRSYCETYAKVWKLFKKRSPAREILVEEICDRRGYSDVDRWQTLFAKVDVAKVDFTTSQIVELRGVLPKELGLFSSNGLLLEGTYMIPIRDMLNNIIAIVGWVPGKKYITTPAKYFDKGCLFFGMEQFGDYDVTSRKPYFIVEGIFDSLSLRSLGFRCLGNMGIDGTDIKSSLMTLAAKVVAIPDGDKAGRGVIQKDLWKLPLTGTYVMIPDRARDFNIKDVDDLIKISDPENVIEEFAKYIKSVNNIEVMDI